MTVEELKKQIESKSFDNSSIIFVSKSKFVPLQYIHEIAKYLSMDITYVEELHYGPNLFGMEEKGIKVHVCDTFTARRELLTSSYTYVICNKVNNQDECAEIVVQVPKLENWQILDYACSVCSGVDQENIKELVANCKYDIHRVDNELAKLTIFDKSQQQSIFNMLMEDNAFVDISKYTIFDFTNALIQKDTNTLCEIYKKIACIDIEPIGLLTVLVNQFRNIISIQLSNNPTPENTGLKPNQFWAIKHSCGLYTKEQLVRIYMFLTEIDKKIKTGNIPMEHLIDYLVIGVRSS